MTRIEIRISMTIKGDQLPDQRTIGKLLLRSGKRLKKTGNFWGGKSTAYAIGCRKIGGEK